MKPTKRQRTKLSGPKVISIANMARYQKHADPNIRALASSVRAQASKIKREWRERRKKFVHARAADLMSVRR